MTIKSTIQKWLDIPDRDELKREVIEQSSDELYEKARKEFNHNARLLKSFTELKCDGCEKLFVTYPFGAGYYRNLGTGKYYHSRECLDKMGK